MSNDEMKRLAGLVKNIVKEEVLPLSEKLESVSKDVKSVREEVKSVQGDVKSVREEVKSISDQVANLTEKVDGEIIPTLERHTKYFKQIAQRLQQDKDNLEKNGDNIQRLARRLSEPEARLGIQPPPELHIIE